MPPARRRERGCRDRGQRVSHVRLAERRDLDSRRAQFCPQRVQRSLVLDLAQHEVRVRVEPRRERARRLDCGVDALDCALCGGEVASGDDVGVSDGIVASGYLHEIHGRDCRREHRGVTSEMRPGGFEPPAVRFRADRSDQLSYGRKTTDSSSSIRTSLRSGSNQGFRLRLTPRCSPCREGCGGSRLFGNPIFRRAASSLHGGWRRTPPERIRPLPS